eukprot:m.22206 g.22206  ORF g.22206 m.22206 type:complete len:385 (-) comp3715_c0_seq2:178-1332(-)
MTASTWAATPGCRSAWTTRCSAARSSSTLRRTRTSIPRRLLSSTRCSPGGLTRCTPSTAGPSPRSTLPTTSQQAVASSCATEVYLSRPALAQLNVIIVRHSHPMPTLSLTYSYCLTAAPNLSFWSSVPSSQPRLPAPTAPPAAAAPYTVVFQTNEGDTPKILAGLMSAQWLHPAHGAAPVSWGINPGIAARFPALVEYYAVTAQPTDSFFAGCSGAGYVYPSKYTPADRALYYQHVEHVVPPAMAAPVVVDIWDYSINQTQLLQYRSTVPAIQCFTFQAKGAATNQCLPDGTPVLQSDSALFYPQLNISDPAGDLEQRIRHVASQHPAPFTIIVYGLLSKAEDPYPQTPELALAMANRLPKDKFSIMSVTQACTQARDHCSAHA